MMAVSTAGSSSSDTTVQWVPNHYSPRRPAPHRTGPSSKSTVPSRRPDRWIIRSVTLATTAFALLDLYLLVSKHH